MFRQTLAAIALLLSGIETALATGNLSCNIDDKALEFSAQSVVPYGRGERIIQFRAQMQVKLKSLPEDLKTLELGEDHLVHHWIDSRETRLMVFWERSEGLAADMKLVVKTQRKLGGDVEGVGQYEMTFSVHQGKGSEPKLLRHRGRATCWVG